MIGVLVGVMRVFLANHLFVQLLAWTNPDELVGCIRGHHSCQVNDFHGGNLLDVDLTAFHVVERMPDELHALLQCNHEARHSSVGNRQHPLVLDR